MEVSMGACDRQLIAGFYSVLVTDKGGVDPDPKIHAMTTMKGDIKHKNVDVSCP